MVQKVSYEKVVGERKSQKDILRKVKMKIHNLHLIADQRSGKSLQEINSAERLLWKENCVNLRKL